MAERINITDSSALEKLECELKELWSQYVYSLDTYGLNETTKECKNRYHKLYQNYKHYKEWKNAVGSN